MIRTVTVLALILASLGAQAALLGRVPLTPGGTDYQAYYDTALSITWLADANYAHTSGYDADGLMTWSAAQTWIGSLNTASHLGVTDWRLPTVTDTGEPGCVGQGYGGTDCGYNVDVSTGEMAHLFYSTLGNSAFYDTNGNQTGCDVAPDYCLKNTGPFSNLTTNQRYWYGTEYAPLTSRVWFFMFEVGYQGFYPKAQQHYAMAVRSGDIALVPIPAVGWLLAPALGVLGWVKRKRAPRT